MRVSVRVLGTPAIHAFAHKWKLNESILMYISWPRARQRLYPLSSFSKRLAAGASEEKKFFFFQPLHQNLMRSREFTQHLFHNAHMLEISWISIIEILYNCLFWIFDVLTSSCLFLSSILHALKCSIDSTATKTMTSFLIVSISANVKSSECAFIEINMMKL